MSGSIRLMVDGREVEVKEGSTLLVAARAAGKSIPTLCNDPRLAPFSSCFVCVVEVEGQRNLVPSCSTPARSGMKVHTDTEAVHEARRTALALLASNHFADCLAPCMQNCPAGVDCQGYIALIAEGDPGGALERIRERNPLPATCGRVCPRPCEDVCRRGLQGEAVAIDLLKRHASDVGGAPQTSPAPSSGYHVAVVGAGPAGLSCAWFLALRGHAVTIYEAAPESGGWLRDGIPSYRLPREVLDGEIDAIRSLGVEIRNGCALGRDITLEELTSRHSAVFLGLGTRRSTPLRIPGEEGGGVQAATEFLASVSRGLNVSSLGRVVVVGGGNTAVDAARTALRLGASTVTVLYRRSRTEMPALASEVDDMEKEGVSLELLVAPTRIMREGMGRVVGLECTRMWLGEPDASGRRRPEPVPGSEFAIPASLVLSATGLEPVPDFAGDTPLAQSLRRDRRGTLQTDPSTGATSVPGIFAGGDLSTGAATVVEAVAGGRRAAAAIHRLLTGEETEPLPSCFLSRREALKPELGFEDLHANPAGPRPEVPVLPVEERRTGFTEVEGGIGAQEAMEEARRCLACGCEAYPGCDLFRLCQEYGVDQGLYAGEFHDETPDESHPFLRLESNKCILCGRCVRICEEVAGACALGFAGRGFRSVVGPPLRRRLQESTCTSCGLCATTCPTGALMRRSDRGVRGPLRPGCVETSCSFCALNCLQSVDMFSGKPVRVRGKEDSEGLESLLCREGHFAFRIQGEKRVTRPLLRRGGSMVPASWDEALEPLKDWIDKNRQKGRADRLAVLVDPAQTVQTAALAARWARNVLGTGRIHTDSVLGWRSADHELASLSAMNLDRLESCRGILALGVDFARFPVLGFRLRILAREGIPVWAVGCGDEVPLRPPLKFHQDPGPGAMAQALAEVAGKLGSGPEAVAEALAPIGLDAPDRLCAGEALTEGRLGLILDWEKTPVRLLDALLLLVRSLEPQVIPLLLLPGASNSLGVVSSGCHPLWEEGWIPAPPISGLKADPLEALEMGEVEALVFMGADPLGGSRGNRWKEALERIPLVVALSAFFTPSVEAASVVLPLPSAFEEEGYVLGGGGVRSRRHIVTTAPSGMGVREVLERIANFLTAREGWDRSGPTGVAGGLYGGERLSPEVSGWGRGPEGWDPALRVWREIMRDLLK